jgi:hypothetical protein
MALHTPTKAALLLILVVASMQPAMAANYYRYVDDNGKKVFTSSIPPEYVARGYEILNDRGLVIQVVPRAATPEEIAARDAAEVARRQQEVAANAQREADAALRLKYRSPDEIAKERDQTLAMVDVDLALARENLAFAELELAGPVQNLAAVAADGGEASAELLAEMENKQQVVERYTEQLARLEADRAQIVATAASNMQRLRELLGLPEEPAAE